MKNKSIIIATILILICFSGCSFNGFSFFKDTPKQEVVVQKVDKDDIREVLQQEKMAYNIPSSQNAVFSAVGEGIAPMNTISPAQALALAKRAAMADAYRNLAAKLYGVKINSKDTVKDAMLKNSSITSQVEGLVKNAAITNEYFQNGLYKVELELEMSGEKWQEIFAY